MSIGIRIIGDKRLAQEIAEKLERLLKISFKVYPYRADRNQEVDPSKTRLYANYSRIFSVKRMSKGGEGAFGK